MSAIYIIAGPPGIGKSTRGHEFIDAELDILNEDEMRFRYKASGYADYNEYSIQRFKDIIRQNLIRDQNFALELILVSLINTIISCQQSVFVMRIG